MRRLSIRPADPRDHPTLERIVLDCFEPITWAKTLDERYGPLNGLDWRARWTTRVRKALAEQIVLVGEIGDAIAAMSSSTLDAPAALAYVDLLAVEKSWQGHGYGREMLRATMDYMRQSGALYMNLECLTTNAKGNALYESEGFEEVARQIRWFRPL
jgi:ribosomal protein S18 acetylase RimI-like enzyme